MSLLLNLPDVLVVNILAGWCDLFCFAGIDTAHSKAQRLRLTQFYKHEWFCVLSAAPNANCIDWMKHKGMRTRNLCLENVSFVYDDRFKCSKIRELALVELTSSMLSEPDLVVLVNNCPLLTVFSARRVTCFNDNVIVQFNTNILKQLKSLKITHNRSDLSGNGIQYCAAFCKNLETVGLALASVEEDDDFVRCLIDGNPKLTSINLAAVGGSVSPETVISITSLISPLKDVTIRKANSSNSVCEIADCIRRSEQILTHFYLQILTDDRGFHMLHYEQKHCDTGCGGLIRNLIFTIDCPTSDIAYFVSHIPQCNKLGFKEVTRLNDSVLQAIIRFQPAVERVVFDNCGNAYTASGLKLLVNGCHELQELALNNINHLSNNDLEHVFTSSINSSLTCLKLFGHSTLKIETVLTILQSIPQLESIVLYKCPLISRSVLDSHSELYSECIEKIVLVGS